MIISVDILSVSSPLDFASIGRVVSLVGTKEKVKVFIIVGILIQYSMVVVSLLGKTIIHNIRPHTQRPLFIWDMIETR